MTAARVSHSLGIARQVHNDEERPRSSREVSLWVKVQVQITGVHGCAQAWLSCWPGPSSKTSTSTRSYKKGWSALARASLQEHTAASAPQVLSKLALSPGSQTPIAAGGWRGKWRNTLTALTNSCGKICNDINFLCTGVSRTHTYYRLRETAGLAGTSAGLWPKLLLKAGHLHQAAQGLGQCRNTPYPTPCFCFATASDIPGRVCCTPLSCGPSPALLPGSHSAPSGLASPSCTSSD